MATSLVPKRCPERSEGSVWEPERFSLMAQQFTSSPPASPRQPAAPPWRRGLIVLGALVVLWAGYLLTGQTVRLVIDGQPHQVRTHALTVGAVIREMGLN